MRYRILIVAALGMVIVGLAATWIATLPLVWALVLLAAGLAAVPFIIATKRRHFDVFEPVYLFAGCYFVLFAIHPAAAWILSGGEPVFVGYPVGNTYVAALTIGAVGAAASYLAYYSPVGRHLAERLALPREEWSTASLAVFVSFCVVAAIGTFSVFLALNGGFSALVTFFSGRNPTSRAALQESSGYLYSAPLWLVPIGILVISLSHRRWRVGALVGFLLVALSQVLSIGTGDRSWTLPAIAALLLVWYLRLGRRPGLPMIASVLAVMFVFGITLPRQYRNTENRGQPLIQLLVDDAFNPGPVLQEFFGRDDTAMVDALAVELQFVPDRIRYQLGRTYLEAVTRPVPRALWPEKPRAAETQLMAEIWPQLSSANVGFAFSLFGEPYLNFGPLGVVLMALVFGVFWRAAYAWFRRAPRNPFVISIYALSWPFLFVYMRGGIGVDYQRQVIYVIPVLVAYLVVRTRRKQLRWPGSSKLWVPERNSLTLETKVHP